jgi:hypothetical protein
MQSFLDSMLVRGSYFPSNGNGNEGEGKGERCRGPMSLDNRNPSIGAHGGNTHHGSEQCGTTCKIVPTNDRDSEGAFSNTEACPGEETSWIGAYERSYMERKWTVL